MKNYGENKDLADKSLKLYTRLEYIVGDKGKPKTLKDFKDKINLSYLENNSMFDFCI